MRRSKDYEYNEKNLLDSGSKSRSKDSSVRHVENPISIENRQPDDGDYGQAENMLDKWGLDRSEASLDTKKRRQFIRITIAVLVTLFTILCVFVILPRVLPRFFEGSSIELFVEKEIVYVYDDSYLVVNYYAVDMMEEPDPTSTRLTQLLYNEPVSLLNPSEFNGYYLVRSEDGIQGYVKSSRLTTDTSSVEPDLHSYKLIVSDTSKNVMTHASNGTLITRVMMNTILYADVKRDGVYQVDLPNGSSGWIGSSGVIEIGTREDLNEVSCRYFVSSVLSSANATYIENGLTQKGMSINGLAYVCSEVNGVPMPRTMLEQSKVGEPVELEYDVVTGELLLDSIKPGDLVFLTNRYSDGEDIDEMAICTDTGVLMMISKAGTTIRLRTFVAGDDISNRIISVRRVFK